MARCCVYFGDSLLGEAEIRHQASSSPPPLPELRISHLSPPSDRCPPLAVLHTVASAGLLFKIDSRPPPPPEAGGAAGAAGEPPLFSLYSACLRDKKTAVVPLGEEELHLVAMSSRKNFMYHSCFWGFTVAPGLYRSCLLMLNRRCLGIVFDLDETLIVANSMRSFEERISFLQKQIFNETDQQRVALMVAEIQRYQEDKSILKQYVETDQVVENGKVFKVEYEVVQPLSESHLQITRPVMRLQDKNIILTRVNPAVRDTSVLVRLRPAWDDLRNYLTARGRKRFEVYVCTMAEREYALEIWRLLDPDSSLISYNERLKRIVCVKTGTRKSLLNVFQDGICHPKLALVIDDRLTVWDDKDKPQVHVVPAFSPYHAPHAEETSAVPVLCVARNVACNVRGVFYKKYDDGVLPSIADIHYEDEMKSFPSAPDMSNYLILEEDNSVPNGKKYTLSIQEVTDTQVEGRLKDAYYNVQAFPPVINNFDLNPAPAIHNVIGSSLSSVSMAASEVITPICSNDHVQPFASIKAVGHSVISEACLQVSPVTEEGEISDSESDLDSRRRRFILQHGQDTRVPPFQLRSDLQVSVQSPGSWLEPEAEMNPRKRSETLKDFPLETETIHFAAGRSHRSSFSYDGENSFPSNRGPDRDERLFVGVPEGNGQLERNHYGCNYDSSQELGNSCWTGILEEIASKCGTKVEFRSALLDTIKLQFCVEAWLAGERIGEGIGRSRKEARNQAAERSVRNLAYSYLLNDFPDSTGMHEDLKKPFHGKRSGSRSASHLYKYSSFSRTDPLPFASTSDDSHFLGHKLEGSMKTSNPVATLRELGTMEGFVVSFRSRRLHKDEVYAQVEISGDILGKGIGMSWEEAKMQAAGEALVNLKSRFGQFTQRHADYPRSKRPRIKISQAPRRISLPGRYSSNRNSLS